MKRNQHYILHKIVNEQILVPTGEVLSRFNGVITLNESGVLMWNLLEDEQTIESLKDALRQIYDVTEEQLQTDVTEFLRRLRLAGALEEAES